MEEKQVKPPTIYAWHAELEPNSRLVIFAYADSQTEAAEKIALRLAKSNRSPDLLLLLERTLQLIPPTEIDFSEGVGIFQFSPRI